MGLYPNADLVDRPEMCEECVLLEIIEGACFLFFPYEPISDATSESASINIMAPFWFSSSAKVNRNSP